MTKYSPKVILILRRITVERRELPHWRLVGDEAGLGWDGERRLGGSWGDLQLVSQSSHMMGSSHNLQPSLGLVRSCDLTLRPVIARPSVLGPL